MPNRLAYTWGLSELHGWGLVGVHTALYLTELGQPPLLLEQPALKTCRPKNREKLEPLLAEFQKVMEFAKQNSGSTLFLKNIDVLHALGNGFEAGTASRYFRGERNGGVIAFENTRFDPHVRQRAQSYDFLMVHSNYNKALAEAQGVKDVRLTFQGIDETEMQVVPAQRPWGDRFVIFSGGKLEFRKAQDLVLAAFKKFHSNHPDALLVTAWQNIWPHTAMSMADSQITAEPPKLSAEGRLDIMRWALENGLENSSFVDLGFLSRDKIAPLLSECHAAVFPNRCEGATNLVAMEAMACGVPTVISANTGHMDIIRDGNSYPLTRQKPVPDDDGSRIGWGESDVDEIVAHLEAIYANRQAAHEAGIKAAQFIRGERTWRAFAEAFVEGCTH